MTFEEMEAGRDEVLKYISEFDSLKVGFISNSIYELAKMKLIQVTERTVTITTRGQSYLKTLGHGEKQTRRIQI